MAEFLQQHRNQEDELGRARLVRNGYLPGRMIQTGIGAVPVTAPRVRDRAGKLRFTSSILPPYLRRTRTIEELLPWLYLKGISTGDFSEALASLLGRDAPGLAAATISRLKAVWQDEHAKWERRDLSNKQYVYWWVDGIHFGVRLEAANQCILVIMGATAEGKKELVRLTDGFRESGQILERSITGFETPRSHYRSQACRWRWAIGFLESAAASVWGDPCTALLGA